MDDISFKWLDFNEHADEIIGMREEIFVQDYGMSRITTISTKDDAGVHLAMYYDRELMGVISGYFFDKNHITVSQYELPICEGTYFQVAKLAVRATNKIHAPGLTLLHALISGVSEQMSFDLVLTFLFAPQFKQTEWYSSVLGFEHTLIRQYNYDYLKIIYGKPSLGHKVSRQMVGPESSFNQQLFDKGVYKAS